MVYLLLGLLLYCAICLLHFSCIVLEIFGHNDASEIQVKLWTKKTEKKNELVRSLVRSLDKFLPDKQRDNSTSNVEEETNPPMMSDVVEKDKMKKNKQ